MKYPDNIQQALRNAGRLSEQEILAKEGDLLVAINVIDNTRRVVHRDHQINEIVKPAINERRVLKG